MSPFDPFQRMDASLIARFGEPVTYSRSEGVMAAVDPFSVSGILSTGGEYADPSGPLFADLFVLSAAIPKGPQKGDTVTIANPKANVASGVYRVQAVFGDAKEGAANLKLRWIGQ